MTTLRSRLLRLAILIFLIPLIITVATTFFYTEGVIQENTQSRNINNVRQQGIILDSVVADLDSLSLQLISSPEIRSYLKADQTATDYIPMEKNAYSLITSLGMTKSYIQSVQLVSQNGQGLSFGNAVLRMNPALMDRAEAASGRMIWDVADSTQTNGAVIPTLVMYRLIRDPLRLEHHLGILAIHINQKALKQLVISSENLPDEQTVLLSQSGNILLPIQDKAEIDFIQPDDYDFLRNHANSSALLKNNSKVMSVTPYIIQKTDWILVSMSSLDFIYQQRWILFWTLSISILVCLLICTPLAIYLARSISMPLKEIGRMFSSIEKENFSGRLMLRGPQEIIVLADQFNRMSERLNTLMNEVYLGTIKRREAELHALQARINPHFLYNTLDNIYWQACFENAFETGAMVKVLSQLFRLTLSDGDFSSLTSEIDLLQCYITIQKRRYGDKVEFVLEVNEDLGDLSVLRNILQPFVENAIFHGIEPTGRTGRIKVRVFQEQDMLIYTIEDNGVGIDPDDIARLFERTEANNRGFAIKNIRDRLKLSYGLDDALIMENRPSGGCLVRITQPVTGGYSEHA